MLLTNPCLSQLTSLYNLGPAARGDGGQSPPRSSSHQTKKCPQTCPQASLKEKSPQWASHFPGNSILNGVDEFLPVCGVIFYCQVHHCYMFKEVSFECFHIYLVFVYVWMLAGAGIPVEVRGQLVKSLSFHVGPVTQAEVIRSGLGQTSSPTRQLTSPYLCQHCFCFWFSFPLSELTLHVHWLTWLPLSSLVLVMLINLCLV